MSDICTDGHTLLAAARAARPSAAARARIDAGLTMLLLAAPVATASPSAPLPATGAIAGGVTQGILVAILSATLGVGGAALWTARQPVASPPTHPTSKPPAQPVTMGETPKPPAQPVTMGETPKPPAQPVTMGETPKPPAQPVTPVVPDVPVIAPSGAAGAVVAVATGERGEPSKSAPRPRAARDISPSPPPRAATPSTEATPTATHRESSLDEELAALRDAQRALKRGDGAEALARLDPIGERYPDGVLREERLAARVLGLCATGRLDEARAAGRRFVAENPGSVQVERVRASCAFAPRSDPDR